MPIYLKQGEYKEALEQILNILGPGPCPSHDLCEGCQYEWEEAVITAKSVLGEPVPRQKCLHCGALDDIYWRSGDPEAPEGFVHPHICHTCGNRAEKAGKDYMWVEEPVDVKED